MNDEQAKQRPAVGSVDRHSLAAGDKLPGRLIRITRKLIIMGATSSRDWQPIHHDAEWARERAGLPDIIMNNYTQAGWLSQYLTSWGGAQARIARMGFSMRSPLCPGDEAVLSAEVVSVTDAGDIRWVELSLAIQVGERVATTASAKLALPGSEQQRSPWELTGAAWRP
tara:strand:+ start:636 stop:1142 length:507 start_codon:yes stop_codon:yes gene_type:complete